MKLFLKLLFLSENQLFKCCKFTIDKVNVLCFAIFMYDYMLLQPRAWP